MGRAINTTRTLYTHSKVSAYFTSTPSRTDDHLHSESSQQRQVLWPSPVTTKDLSFDNLRRRIAHSPPSCRTTCAFTSALLSLSPKPRVCSKRLGTVWIDSSADKLSSSLQEALILMQPTDYSSVSTCVHAILYTNSSISVALTIKFSTAFSSPKDDSTDGKR